MITSIEKATLGLKVLGNSTETPMRTKFNENSKSHKVITTPQGRFMQSYETIIAFISTEGEVVLNTEFAQSRTTSFYRCQFLNELGVETKRKLKSGRYTQMNLN